MQAVLVMFRSDGERRSFSVTRSITVIGRREDCDLRIPVGDVSRKHCRLVRDGETMRLEDLGSSNGTYHNGVRVERDAELAPGDSIQVGPVVFVLQVDGVPADEELHPITVDSAGAAAMAAAAPSEMPVPPPMPSAAGAPPLPPAMAAAEDGIDAMEGLEPLPDDADFPTGQDELEALQFQDDLGNHAADGAPAGNGAAHPPGGDDEPIALDDDLNLAADGHEPEPIPLDDLDFSTEPPPPPRNG